MDFSPLSLLAPTLFWLLPLAFAIGLLKSPWVKGYLGELLVRLVARWRLDRQTYRRLHNVTLPTPDGTTQIDHVFLSRYGIFVVETKNMRGWIFGSERQAQWAQKLYRRTFRFQNPLPQKAERQCARCSILLLIRTRESNAVVVLGIFFIFHPPGRCKVLKKWNKETIEAPKPRINHSSFLRFLYVPDSTPPRTPIPIPIPIPIQITKLFMKSLTI